jgi:hypothetical protein
MTRGLGRWQRAALALLSDRGDEMLFDPIACALGATTLSERIALRRALDRLASSGQLGKKAGKRMYGGPRDIVWFALRRA